MGGTTSPVSASLPLSAGRFALVLSLRCGALALWPCLHLSVLPLLASLVAMAFPHSTGGGKWL